MTKSNKTIGIDLGTSNSCVSVFENGETVVIANAEGKRTTPSIVSFSKDGETKIGDAAKRQAVMNPTSTISSIKRLMGKTYDQVKDIKLPYTIVNDKGRPAVLINDRKYSPEEISAMILQKMKKTAEDYLGAEVTKAVITVPAYFNNEEREATKIAGQIAGLEVERIINEPTAAALAYGQDKLQDAKIVVFDFGGGTHDVSILEMGDGVFEVRATDGDVNLGGDNVDELIVDWLCEEFKKDQGVDLRTDIMALQRVREAAEKAKIELSSTTQTEINLPYITPINGVPQHLVRTLSRSKFDQLIDSIVQRTIVPCKTALEKAGLTVDKIDHVILVGGSTRIPAIQDAVKKFFGKEPNKSANVDECVSEGASIQGAVLTKEINDIVLLDVLPISLGIETMGQIFTKLVEANTTIPTDKTEVFSNAADNQTSVEIHVLQGERSRSVDNKSLGRFTLTNLPPAQRGQLQIEVKLSVDANSILTVSAIEKTTGQKQSIRIENSTSLSKEEIERMRNDAAANAEADKRFKEEAEKINAAESTIFQADKQLKEFGDKVTAETKANVESLLKDLTDAKNNKDFAKIEDITTRLNQELSKFYSEMQQNQTTNESQHSEPVNTAPENVEAVDFEEVK